MNLLYTFRIAIIGLKTNKSRTVLTILGIVIGITSIILVMSLGRGAQNLILGQVQGIGSKTIAIAPGKQPKSPTDFASLFADSLKERDLESLKQKNNVPTLDKIMPIVFGSESATFENITYRPTIWGATSLFAIIYNVYPTEGENLSEDDVKSYSDVVVIGNKVKEELFNGGEAVGKKIKIKGRNFRVIGVLPQTGQVSFVNFDSAVVMPYTTAQQYIFGIKYFHRIVVQADSEANVEQTVADIKTTLRNNHNITDPDKDDFFVETQADAVKTVSTITSVLTLFLAAVAAISLLVGGVGIMNIMLVSVTERTREIGLRKALGATNGDILKQFLVESVILTTTGGLIGIALGSLLSLLISVILTKTLGQSWPFSVPLSSVLLGVGVSAIIGMIFGIYPARQASIKNPIEALRYE